jgi:hypothetical protein
VVELSFDNFKRVVRDEMLFSIVKYFSHNTVSGAHMTTVSIPKKVAFTDQFGLVLLLLPLLLGSAFAQTTPTDSAPFLIIAQVEGHILVAKGDTQWAPANAHDFIFANSTLQLDEYSSAIIVTETGDRFALKPNSEIGFTESGLRAIRGTLQKLPKLTLDGLIGPIEPETSGRSLCGASRWSGVRLNGPGFIPPNTSRQRDEL